VLFLVGELHESGVLVNGGGEGEDEFMGIEF